jgi:arabinofuranan 3-O-arabinosyltransferase
MTLQALHRGRAPIILKSDGFRLACFGLLVANLAYLAALLLATDWIVGPNGQPIHTDFTSVYAAGRLVLAGHPAAAYDWNLHYAAENAVAAHDPKQYLGWHYPPPFLMIAGLLAALPYVTAFAVWIAVTLPLYLATIRAIVGDKIGWLIGGAFPCLMPNIVPGQNGFLTASLVGGTLVLLERQPVLAGCCLGLLTYKPQFGILFPLVLAAGGYWRTIGAAAATAAALALATIVLFGVTPWTEFFHWLPLTSQALFSDGHNTWIAPDHTAWNKFQSVLAMVRMLGGGASLAWTLQLAVAAITPVVLCVMWRSKSIAFELKAAAAATGILLATPYVYLYDLTVLAVAAAFLIRCALASGLVQSEAIGLAAIAALFLILPFLGVPVGLMAAAIVALLIARRAFDRGGQAALAR